jgi:hypothetical protein
VEFLRQKVQPANLVLARHGSGIIGMHIDGLFAGYMSAPRRSA